MIGTSIKGIRHLWRMSDCSLKKMLVRCGDHGFDICEVIKTPKTCKIGENLFIFNSFYNQTNYGFNELRGLSEELTNLLSNVTFSHGRVFQIAEGCFKMYEGFFSEMTLLPDSFDNDYDLFLKENSKMIKNLSTKYHIDMYDIRYKRLYVYTEGSRNFFQWAVDLYCKGGCSIRTIQNILIWNECYKQLTKNLSKGTITAYTSTSSINGLMEELTMLRNEKRINDAINSFNTAQKKLLRGSTLSDVDKKTLARFSKLSEAKQINFVRKVSTIDDFQELMRQMRHVTSVHFNWSKESFMDFIHNVEGIKYEIIYENEFVVLVKVSDYETIKQLGKTTNWCISKNKTYWNNYIAHKNGKATQYMIFDFSKIEDDKLSIVGFTTMRNKGITCAHNFTNENIMGESQNIMLKSYLEKFSRSNNIYKVLQNCGIDINLVANYDKPPYEWDYNHLMSYLYECVEKDNVDVIKYDGSKLVLSVTDKNIKYFFGDAYIENMPREMHGMQHIIFADFSISQYDPNKLIFAIIYTEGVQEDYCECMYNESISTPNSTFDTKLSEFDIPYDIIRRPNKINKRVEEAFTSFNPIVLRECIKNDKNCLDKVLKEYLDSESILHVLNTSIIEYMSFDIIDMIYESHHELGEYLDSYHIGKLLDNILSRMRTVNRTIHPDNIFYKPSDGDIEDFYNNKLALREKVIYIGGYISLKKIITHESKEPNKMFGRIIANIYNSTLKGELIKEIFYMVLGKVEMENKTDTTTYIISYFSKYGDKEMKDTFKNLASKHQWVKNIYETNMKKAHVDVSSHEFAFSCPF